MEGLTACSVGGRQSLRFPSTPLKSRRSFHLRVRAAREGPELDKWDQMELKFGRLLGEDPKLTLAKIMAKKANPDVSYLEVEKSFARNKGKIDGSMFNIPTDVNVESRKPSDSPRDGTLSLSRPVMNKATKTTTELNLLRPNLRKGSVVPVEKPTIAERPKNKLTPNVDDNKVAPNIALRKPDAIQEDELEPDKYSRLKIKPNIFLKMRKDNEIVTDVSLLKKPEVIHKPINTENEKKTYGASSSEVKSTDAVVKPLSPSQMLQDRPEMIHVVETSEGSQGRSELQPPGEMSLDAHDVKASSTLVDENQENYKDDDFKKASLLGKPQRLDSSAKKVLASAGEATANLDEGDSSATDIGNLLSAEQEELEDHDWKRANHFLHTGERAEVELVSSSSRGFVVSFGSLAGFLPYRNLGAKWKFLAFESWLRKKGLDPSLHRQNLSIIGNYDVPKNIMLESNKSQEISQKDKEAVAPDMTFEDLLAAYDQEKTKFLSSFVGQRIKASVLLADRNSRKLMFSGKPKEKEELVENKRNLMAKLTVGDVVKCCIKKITYFGIFVEVEGVPALIHQSEVSWDTTLDPSAVYKIGQIVEAKVHQLDFALERIFLSLKEIMPDPLMGALESVVGGRSSLEPNLEAAQADNEEWADVESLIEELHQIDGVQSVSKGRFFLSPGLAPTFQVYMASVLDSQYKLLARSGNKVQEVLVQSLLNKDQMKDAILSCTNRVK